MATANSKVLLALRLDVIRKKLRQERADRLIRARKHYVEAIRKLLSGEIRIVDPCDEMKHE